MSYSTIAKCANDASFLARVAACVSQESPDMNPESAARMIVWQVSAHSDIEASYAYALNVGNPDPGGDETVITDQMILSAVQPLIPLLPPQPPAA